LRQEAYDGHVEPDNDAMLEAMADRVRLKALACGVDLRGELLLEVTEAVMLKRGTLLERVRIELAKRGLFE
jgi:hypothetical protein